MSRRRAPAVEVRLAELGRLRDGIDAEKAGAELRAALGDGNAQVVALAARLAAQLGRNDLVPELGAAFLRALDDPRFRDPGCAAKTAIAGALVDLEAAAVEVFRRGVRHVQEEPVYGGRVDVAAQMRAHCAVGLAATEAPDLMLELADLLADPEPVARCGAIRAIAASGRVEAPPLLRFKARLGDEDAEAAAQCFAALLAVDPDGSLAAVADALDDEDDAVAEAAALALGESRSHAAFPVLRAAADRIVHGERRRVLLTAVALLRLDVAIDHLLGLVEGAPVGVAADAVAALGLFLHDEDLRRRVEEAVSGRNEARLEDELRTRFAR